MLHSVKGGWEVRRHSLSFPCVMCGIHFNARPCTAEGIFDSLLVEVHMCINFLQLDNKVAAALVVYKDRPVSIVVFFLRRGVYAFYDQHECM